MQNLANNFGTIAARQSSARWRQGFTLIELCLGLVVSAMIASALAAFTLAVANCWRQTDATQGAVITVNQLTLRLQNRLQDAKRLGYWTDGSAGSPAGMIYWVRDTNGDGQMQYTELA